MKEESDFVEAVAVKGDRIIASGTYQQIKDLSNNETLKVNLVGKLVLPGFCDTHTHLETIAEGMININLKEAQTIGQVMDIIKENVPAEPDNWVVSSWWHPFAQLREKRLPTRFEIDKVCPFNPVLLTTVGHIAVANSRALEIAGIDRSSPDPEGGRIERDKVTGDVNGVLQESAIRLVQRLIPLHSKDKLEQKYAEVMAAQNRVGLTSAFTGASTPEDLGVWKSLHSKGLMSVRVNLAVIPTGEETPRTSEEEFRSALDILGASLPVSDSFLSLGCIKLVLDGGMTLKTASLSEPYPDEPGNYGIMTMDQKRLNVLVDLCNKGNFRVGVHAVGDRAIDAVLNSYERTNEQKAIVGKRFILIHGFLIRPDQIRRAARLGLIVATQNVFMYEKAEVAARFLGETRSNSAIPTRSMIDGGLVVTGGSDADVNSFNPFLGIYQAVARRSKKGTLFGSEERIGRWEALCMYTKWAALQTFQEGIKGVLEPGKLADLIVTSTDITACPEEEIKEARVLMTMVGGKIVHSVSEAFH